MGVERAKPSACTGNRYWRTFHGWKAFLFSCLAQQDPKYCPKRKSCRIGSALRGSPLLQGFPSFPHSPPDCLRNSPFSERTASSASRKCVSFFGIPDLEGFISCEKAYESVPCANKGLCPFETCKPLKRLDLNFLAFLFEVRKVEYNRRKSRSGIAGCIAIPKRLYFTHSERRFSI